MGAGCNKMTSAMTSAPGAMVYAGTTQPRCRSLSATSNSSYLHSSLCPQNLSRLALSISRPDAA